MMSRRQDTQRMETPRREMLTDRQRTLVIQVIRELRPEWDVPGVQWAIRETEAVASTPEAAMVACIAAAGNRAYRSPAMMPKPGRHWPTHEDSEDVKARGRTYAISCVDHPQEVMPCRACAAAAVPPTAEQIAAIREAARRLRPTETRPGRG